MSEGTRTRANNSSILEVYGSVDRRRPTAEPLDQGAPPDRVVSGHPIY